MQNGLDIPRRTLLRGASVLCVSALAGASLDLSEKLAFAQDAEKSPANQDDAQYGFLVSVSNCVNCQQCVEACRRVNNTPKGVEARREVKSYTSMSGQAVFASGSCMHCEHPACMEVCPACAISKGKGGVVTVNLELCIGCKYCYQACPFGVPHYTSEGMDKCDCCLEAGVRLGEAPSCVKACKFRALYYGKMDELVASSGDRAKRVESPTGPSYLLQ